MARSLRSKKKKRRWLVLPLFSLLLLAAAGVVLYRCPPSLQDIGRTLQSAVSKFSSFSAGQAPAETVLRGTVYDRKFNELAVSYRLYSLVINPVEIDDRRMVAEALAPLIGEKAEQIETRLKSSTYSMVLSDDLEERTANQITALKLRGVSCKQREARFYPGHTAASHVLGFMGDGVGLAGVEGKYDAVLQSTPFRKINIPDIDFQGAESLGATGTDLILTLDIDLQKQLEDRFREYLAVRGAEKGMGLLIEPGSGRILALVNQPSFNPNYFWKANESNRINRMYNHVLDKELIRPILARAAAIERAGLDGPGVLPPWVAAPNYGFLDQKLDAFEQQIQLFGSVFGNWESGPGAPETPGAEPVVTGVQVGVTLASLINGGWRITPYVVDSLYDHATGKRYYRSSEATEKHHVLDPALGVIIRRELFNNWLLEQENMIAFTAEHQQIGREKAYSRYSIQDLFVGMTPARQPRYLLLMAVEQEHLNPSVHGRQGDKAALEALGKELLASVGRYQLPEGLAQVPPPRSMENYRQFFISKRLNIRQTPGQSRETVAKMPQIRGLSLRKGLQQIDKIHIRVRINGSGRIIAQYPQPGTPLTGIDECIVTLDSR